MVPRGRGLAAAAVPGALARAPAVPQGAVGPRIDHRRRVRLPTCAPAAPQVFVSTIFLGGSFWAKLIKLSIFRECRQAVQAQMGCLAAGTQDRKTC